MQIIDPARVVTPEQAREVLWTYGALRDGLQPGTFTQHLIAAIAHADERNRRVLAAAYPGLSAAVHTALDDGLDTLRTIAQSRR
jgi:streptomycin 6-kinase